VREGVDNFDELVRIFQIGYRPSLHLVADMWHNGHLYLDLGNGRIQLTSLAREKLGSERDGELEGGQRSSRTVPLMLDLIAGQIFPERGRPLQHPGEHLLPMVLDRGYFRRCEQIAIRTALRQSSSLKEDPGGQPREILSVHLPLASLTEEAGGAALRYLKLKVSCSLSPSGRLRISLLHPDWMGGALRRRLENQLVSLADERPNEPVFQMLRDSAPAQVEEQAEGLETYLVQFRAILDDLAEVAPTGGREVEEARLRQPELESLVDLVLDELQEREKQHIRTRVLEGLETIDGAITTAIGEAKFQIVLSCPAVHWSRFRNYIQVIERSLKNDVRVFVLWGLTPDEELEPEVKNAFVDLKRRGDFRWSRYSLRTNGRFFLKDYDLAVFTGVNFLGPARFASPALAVLVQGEGKDGKRCQCKVVHDQLEQVSRTALESDIAHGLFLPEPEPWRDNNSSHDSRPSIPTSAAPAYGVSFFNSWRDGWLDCSKQLEERLGGLGHWAEVVSGGRHREVMERLLEQCRRRLVLGSALVASRGLDPLLCEALRKVARSKVSGLILYGEAQQDDEAAVGRLQHLIEEFPVQFLIARAPLQGGVLIADDTLLLTSFSFLARDAYEPVTERRRRRLETGLLLHSGEVADTVAAALFKAAGYSHSRRAGPAGQLADVGAASRPSATAVTRGAVPARLREVIVQLSSRGQASPGACLNRWFSVAATSEAAFGELETLVPMLPEVDRRAAVAACLKVHGEAVSTEKRRWRLWLAEGLWHEEAFHEAAVMLESLRLDISSDRLPPPWIADLASAGSESGRLAALLAEAALRNELDDREAAAATCIACPALLIHGIGDAWDLLSAAEAQTPAPLTAWSRAVREYWLECGQPITSSVLLPESGTRRQQAALESLREAHQDAANIDFRFPLGQFTWGRLFGPLGDIASLAAGITKGDLAKVERWLNEFDREGLNPERLVDRTVEAINKEHPNLRGQTIEGGKKRIGVTKLGALLDAARAWILSERAARKEDGLPIEQAQKLGRRLKESLPEMEELVLSWKSSTLYPAPLVGHLMAVVAGLWKAQ